jgi:hypothetical protein
MSKKDSNAFKGYFNYYLRKNKKTLKSFYFFNKKEEEIENLEKSFQAKAYRYVGKVVVKD